MRLVYGKRMKIQYMKESVRQFGAKYITGGNPVW